MAYFVITLLLLHSQLGSSVAEKEIAGPALSSFDFANGENLILQDLIPDPDLPDPLEEANMFEGDIATRPEVRNGIPDPHAQWPDAVVPYSLSSNFTSDDRAAIARAMNTFHENTCIRFVPLNPMRDEDYVFFIRNGSRGCFSFVGRQGGEQVLNLGERCRTPGLIMHELDHAIGIRHQNNRPDRDDFITINWQNIKEGDAHFFQRDNDSAPLSWKTIYEAASLMHFGEKAFTKDRNLKTIVSKGGQTISGQRENLTPDDMKDINNFYECPDEERKIKIADDDCKNKHLDCDRWAADNECITNHEYMERNCNLACQMC